MDGFPALAAAASATSDGITRSAFIAATQHFLHSHGNQQLLQPQTQLNQAPNSQSRCSSCGRGFALFGVGLALGHGRRGLRTDHLKGGKPKVLEHTGAVLTLNAESLGGFGLTCGSAASIVSAVGGSSVGGSGRKKRSRKSRQEPAQESDPPTPLEALLVSLKDPGRFWTNVALAANIAVYLGQVATGHNRMLFWGAKVNELISRGQFWRFVTANFLHSGVTHLLLNCFSLNNAGSSWERVAGGPRFLAVYAVASVTTVLASYKYNAAPAVGASGAIFGLVGALSVYAFRYMRLFRGEEGRKLFDSMVQTVVVNALLGATIQRVDNWGHAGGLVGGAAAAYALGPAYQVNYHANMLIDRPPLKKLVEFLASAREAKGD